VFDTQLNDKEPLKKTQRTPQENTKNPSRKYKELLKKTQRTP